MTRNCCWKVLILRLEKQGSLCWITRLSSFWCAFWYLKWRLHAKMTIYAKQMTISRQQKWRLYNEKVPYERGWADGDRPRQRRYDLPGAICGHSSHFCLTFELRCLGWNIGVNALHIFVKLLGCGFLCWYIGLKLSLQDFPPHRNCNINANCFEFSVENAERMEKCPWKMKIFYWKNGRLFCNSR